MNLMFSGMLKYVVAVMGAALLALAGYNFYLRNEAVKLYGTIATNTIVMDTQDRELKAGVVREKTFASTLKKYQEDNAALNRKQKESNDKLEQALAANKDWADQSIPDGIASWLRDN